MPKFELKALLLTAAIIVLLVIGYFTIDGPWRTVDPAPPEDDNVTLEGGADVDDTPPSAEQDIDDP